MTLKSTLTLMGYLYVSPSLSLFPFFQNIRQNSGVSIQKSSAEMLGTWRESRLPSARWVSLDK